MRARTAAISAALICACAGGPVAMAATQTATAATGTTSTPSTTTTAPPAPMLRVCIASVRRVIASRLGVRAAAIHTRQLLASNGMPQCNFVVARARRGGPHGKVVITANVDSGPQAHWRLMRKVVEATQIFGPVPKGFRPPRQVAGLGPYASWFPALDQLMAINVHGRYLLTVGVIWRHSTPAEKIAVTRSVITIYRHIPRLAG